MAEQFIKLGKKVSAPSASRDHDFFKKRKEGLIN